MYKSSVQNNHFDAPIGLEAIGTEPYYMSPTSARNAHNLTFPFVLRMKRNLGKYYAFSGQEIAATLSNEPYYFTSTDLHTVYIWQAVYDLIC